MPQWIPFFQHVLVALTAQKDLFAISQMNYSEKGFYPGRRRRWQQRLGRVLGVRLFSHQYAGVVGRIHVHDAMLPDDSREKIEHYIHVGNDAVRNINNALQSAGRSFNDIGSCLDMACGSGRVLRILQTKIHPSKITACDVDEEALRFLAAEFSVKTILSTKNPRFTKFSRKYDLIWVGSLFSHLQPTVALGLFEHLIHSLAAQGVLVFTTHGIDCLERLPEYGTAFVSLEKKMLREIEKDGCAFAPYSANSDPDYGTTIFDKDWLERTLVEKFGHQIRPIYFARRGWDNHQDVFGFQRL